MPGRPTSKPHSRLHHEPCVKERGDFDARDDELYPREVNVMGFVVAALGASSLLAMATFDLFTRVRWLGVFVVAYAVSIGLLATGGVLAPSATQLPPLGLLLGQIFGAVLVTSAFSGRTKEMWRAIPLRRYFMWHSVRLPVGLVMIAMTYAGELAPEFGRGAGWGEVIVGAWALVYVIMPRTRSLVSTTAWCAVGLLDVFAGVFTAVLTFDSPVQRFHHAPLMRVMSAVPLVVVPSFSMAVLSLSTVLVYLRRREELILPANPKPARI